MDKENSFKLLDAYFDLGVSYPHANFRVTYTEADFTRAILSTLPTISKVLFSVGGSGLTNATFACSTVKMGLLRNSLANGLKNAASGTSLSLLRKCVRLCSISSV
jgi:hypothetical protein